MAVILTQFFPLGLGQVVLDVGIIVKIFVERDQRAGFVRVGETPRGVLWRVDGDISERDGLTGGEATTAWLISAGQIAAGTIALLLAIPTARTREFTRMEPRIVGRRREGE